MTNKKPMIFDYQNYLNNDNFKKIKIRTPETRNDNILIPIKHKINDQNVKYLPLLFKTPKMYMPFKPNYSSSNGYGYIRLSFDNIKIDQNVKVFYQFITNLESHLHNMLIDSDIFKNAKFKMISTIQKSDGYSDYFNLNFKNEDINVYDMNLENIDINNVKGQFYGFFVIELAGFYYNKKTKTSKLIWNVLQFKLDQIKKKTDTCLFLDETPTEIINNDKPIKTYLKNVPELEKFFKMLSVGIPKMAVQLKMNLSKVDQRFIDYPPDTDLNTLPDELKSKLVSKKNEDDQDFTEEKKNNSTELPKQQISISSLFGQNMNTNIKLKKIDKNDIKSKKIIQNNKSLVVPSLQEITDAYTRLLKKSPEN
jgi:hypothetical protein